MEEETNLQLLDNLDDQHLRPEFLAAVEGLKSKIFSQVKPKVLHETFVTGDMLLDLCTSYVDAINVGSVPCIESTWDYIWQFEWDKLIKQLTTEYSKDLSEVLSTTKIPLKEVEEKNWLLVTKYVAKFESTKLGGDLDTQRFQEHLKNKLNKAYTEILSEVRKSQIDKAQVYLKSLVSDINMKIRKGDAYDSLQSFFTDLDSENEKFEQEFPLIDPATKAYHWKQKTRKLVSLMLWSKFVNS